MSTKETRQSMKLNINDLFWTFQGEGYYTGRRALFVRMPFCNLACSWCDTSFNTFKEITEAEFLAYANQAPEADRFAVITGGEPALNKHTKRVLELLKKNYFEVAIESNGTAKSEIYSLFDYVTISPKKFSEDKKMSPYYISPQALKYADEFKYVVDSVFDFSVLKRHSSLSFVRLSLSPEYNDFNNNLKKIMDYIEENPHWVINLQTHKIIGVK